VVETAAPATKPGLAVSEPYGHFEDWDRNIGLLSIDTAVPDVADIQ